MFKNRNRHGISKSALLFVMCTVLLSGCSEQTPEEALLQVDFMTAPEVRYQTAVVEKGSYIQTEKDKLTVVYTKEENLSWEKDNARFKEVFVRRNQTVKAGDILMSFSIEVSEAELAALRLRLQRAGEDMESGIASREQEIREKEENARYLGYYEGQIAHLQIEKMRVEYERYVYQMQQEIAELEEQIAEIEAEKENNVLRAPFDGVVSKVADWVYGGKVPSGKPLITIYAPDEFLLRGPQNPELRYDMPVTVEMNTSAEPLPATIISAANILPSSLNPGGVMVRLDAERQELGRTIRMNAQTRVMQNVLTIDSDAIRKEAGKNYVYVLDGDMPRKRYVEVGADSGETAWILDGLSEGMLVITELEG